MIHKICHFLATNLFSTHPHSFVNFSTVLRWSYTAHLFWRLTLVSQDNVSETNPRGCEYQSLCHCIAIKQLCFMNLFHVAWVGIILCPGKVWMSLCENSHYNFSVSTRYLITSSCSEKKNTLEETIVLRFHNGCTSFHSCEKRMNI